MLKTKTSQRGGSDIWLLVLLGALVVWALLGYRASGERLEALRAPSCSPRARKRRRPRWRTPPSGCPISP